MIKLDDILAVMERSQNLRIYIAEKEWYRLNVITAVNLLPNEIKGCKVLFIQIKDNFVIVFLQESEQK